MTLSGDDQPGFDVDDDPRPFALWAFLGAFPEAGSALRPTLEAWERDRLRATQPE